MANLNIPFSEESLKKYYSEYFISDLRRYFVVETREDGVELISCERTRSLDYDNLVWRKKKIAALIAYKNQQEGKQEPTSSVQNGSFEDELYSIGLLSALFTCQAVILRRNQLHVNDLKKVAAFFKILQLPMIFEVFRKDESCSLDYFLEESRLHYYPKNEVNNKKYLELCELAFSFVGQLVTETMRNHGEILFPNDTHIEEKINLFKGYYDDALFQIKHGLTPQRRGLSQTDFSPAVFQKYFENDFMAQFDDYFRTVFKDGYRCVYNLGWEKNKRLTDGDPGKSVQENFMFSVATLHLIFAEQCIDSYAPEAKDAFHKACGWPEIYSESEDSSTNGLLMIDKAGLAPSDEELLIYIKAMESAELYFVENFNAILNNKAASIRNAKDGEDLISALNAKNKTAMKEQFVSLINQAKDIIKKRIEKKK